MIRDTNIMARDFFLGGGCFCCCFSFKNIGIIYLTHIIFHYSKWSASTLDYMVSLAKSPLANQIGAHLVSGYSFFSEPQVNTRTIPLDYVSFREIIQYDVLDYVIPIRLLVFLGIIFRTVSRLAEVSVWIPGGDRQRVEASPSKSQVRIPRFHRFIDKCIII